jgi:hypothetical protein
VVPRRRRGCCWTNGKACSGKRDFLVVIEFLKNIFTARDNLSFSLSKLIGVGGSAAMIFNFLKSGSVDFQGFAIGLGALISALAVKYFVEDKQ